MKLDYRQAIFSDSHRAARLTNQQAVIELHIKQNISNTFTLACLSGTLEHIARHKLQGPFHSIRQAQGAANAIITSLVSDGFLVTEEAVRWELEAQRLCNEVKRTKQAAHGTYAFDPKDVY